MRAPQRRASSPGRVASPMRAPQRRPVAQPLVVPQNASDKAAPSPARRLPRRASQAPDVAKGSEGGVGRQSVGGAVLSSPRVRVLDLNDDYASSEDPDYNMEGETDEEEEEALDDDFFKTEDVEIMEPAPLAQERLYREKTQDDRLVKLAEQQDEDILVDSDFIHSDSAAASDSVVDTDEEHDPYHLFSSWRTSRIREWLVQNHVLFDPNGMRPDLISLARAHALHLETLNSRNSDSPDVQEVPSARSKPVKRPDNLRRRVLTAPCLDVDDDTLDDEIEIQPVRRTSSKRRGIDTPRPPLFNSPTPRASIYRLPDSSWPRHTAILSVFILAVFLILSACFAVSVLHKHVVMPFCDTQAIISKLFHTLFFPCFHIVNTNLTLSICVICLLFFACRCDERWVSLPSVRQAWQLQRWETYVHVRLCEDEKQVR